MDHTTSHEGNTHGSDSEKIDVITEKDVITQEDIVTQEDVITQEDDREAEVRQKGREEGRTRNA